MAKPTINQIRSFDAATEKAVEITWSGTISGTRIVIFESSTGDQVYDSDMVTGTSPRITIPANTLSNGRQYYAGVYVYDRTGAISDLSDYSFFICYSTPIFRFSGISGTTITIDSTGYEVNIDYQQAEGRKMMSYNFYLYDSSKRTVSVSDTFYDESFHYNYKGLLDSEYYIQAIGETVDNVHVETDLIKIVSTKKSGDSYYVFNVTNNHVNGYIEYNTNVVQIEYTGDEDFVVKNGRLDLTDGRVLYYDQGYRISGDFSIYVKVKNLKADSETPFVMLNDDESNAIKIFLIQKDDKARFVLNVADTYYLFSDYFTFNKKVSSCYVVVKKKNGIYDLYNSVTQS